MPVASKLPACVRFCVRLFAPVVQIRKKWYFAVDSEHVFNIHMFNMKALTKRQEEVLNYLCSHCDRFGYWPSIREIQAHFDFKSTNAVMGHLRALERKHAIERVAGQARAYRIVLDLSHNQQDDGQIEVVDLPIYGNIAAGYPDGVESSGEIGRIQLDCATAGINRSRRPFALKVRGDSMHNAGIYDGDIVIIETGEPRNGHCCGADRWRNYSQTIYL